MWMGCGDDDVIVWFFTIESIEFDNNYQNSFNTDIFETENNNSLMYYYTIYTEIRMIAMRYRCKSYVSIFKYHNRISET